MQHIRNKIYFLISLNAIIAIFLFYLNLYAQDAEELFRQGTVLIKNSNYDLAVNKLEECIRVDPNHIGCQCNLGVAYSCNGKLEEAIKNIEGIIYKESFPSRGILFYNLGNLYKEKGNKEKARDNYNSAIKLMPYFAQPYGGLAAIHFENNEQEKATEYLYKANSMDSFLPDIVPQAEKTENIGYIRALMLKTPKPALYLYHSPAWYLSSAIDYINRNKTDDAIREIENANQVLDRYSPLESDRRALAEVHLYKGAIYLLKKDVDNGLREYQTAYNIDPQHVGVITVIGFIYLLKGEYDKASQYCQMALYINPDFPNALKLKEALLSAGKK